MHLSTNSSKWCDNLVEPMDFLKAAYEKVVDREILECLYSAQRPLSVSDITDVMKIESNSGDGDVKHPDRNIRIRLKKLVKIGDVEETIREATGRRERAPYVYELDNDLRKEIDDYLNIKKTQSKDIVREPVPGLVKEKDGSPLLAKVVYHTEFSETKGQKTCISRGWATPSSESDRKPWLLRAMLTAQDLGDLPPSDARIEKLKKELRVSTPPTDASTKKV